MRDEKSIDPHRAQLLWTLCVAVAVGAAALWQVASPRRFPSRLEPTDAALRWELRKNNWETAKINSPDGPRPPGLPTSSSSRFN